MRQIRALCLLLLALTLAGPFQQYLAGRAELAELAAEGLDDPRIEAVYELRYRGQAFELAVPGGTDPDALREAFAAARDRRGGDGRPTVLLATTAKGRGVSFTEGTYTWHNGVPTEEQLDRARRDLGIDEEVGAR